MSPLVPIKHLELYPLTSVMLTYNSPILSSTFLVVGGRIICEKTVATSVDLYLNLFKKNLYIKFEYLNKK